MNTTIEQEQVAVLKAVIVTFIKHIDLSKLNINETIALTMATKFVEELKTEFGTNPLDNKKMKDMYDNTLEHLSSIGDKDDS